ncbi:MAG TPA: PAS domain-containing protein [Bradyrhizobium sp.]|nr:PAS domain-containing protein [Bradyrhizobium sp.]
MSNAEFQLRGISDPRLAVHATSAIPAWLWSIDGTQVLWANAVGAKIFGAGSGAALTKKLFGPADAHRRQVARLARTLPLNGAARLERLRGFGAPPGMLVTCGCARLDFADGSQGVLVTAAENISRSMPLPERLQRLVDCIDAPIAAFSCDGTLVGASEAARPLLFFRNLSEAGLDDARSSALIQGRVETPIGSHHMVLQRVGHGADIGLVALITPAADQPIPDYELPATSGEAPAEFALFDEFAELTTSEITVEQAASEPAEPDPQTVSQFDGLPIEASHGEAPPQTTTPDPEVYQDEPSPYIEAVADEPATPPTAEPSPAIDSAPPSPADAPSWLNEPSPDPRQQPLRFTWRMDAGGRFALDPGEFTHLIGPRTAAGFDRPWSEIAETFGLDPDGRVLRAVATSDTWTGITLSWPVDGGGRLAVELSGLPIYDRARNLAGYRGFGVCRDLEALTRLAALQRFEFFSDPPAPPAAGLADEPDVASSGTAELPASIASETSQPTDLETSVETPKNVLPFRSPGETKSPTLTPVENSAFNELARQLSERLGSENGGAAATTATSDAPEATAEQPAAPEVPEQSGAAPEWLAPPEPPARGEGRRDKALLDLLPVGVLIYRLDRLLYANAAFLERMGYASLHALEEAGGLDALYVEPGVSSASSTSDTGTPVTISASQFSAAEAPAGIDAHLFTISWDDDSALALIFSGTGTQSANAAAAIAQAIPASPPPAVGHADEFGAILDTTAEGIVMFDAAGSINFCNRSAEALFGYDGTEFVRRNFTELFAPESQRVVKDYLESIRGSGAASLPGHGRDVLGRVSRGGLIPLSMTMGRTRAGVSNFFAVFRDLSQVGKSESELREARRLADRAASAKADMLARISHEVRTPLNAIIGFAEVMIDERFGALGNERYVEYMKDIRASGERVIAIIDDLLDLSRIETGKLDLAFASQSLNDTVENCVAVMQPQANRERIIIRTSLAHALPPVVADARALRQITLNLIGNSMHLANAGGQVIVSTALTDFGEVILRIRDSGQGLNDNEVAAAMEPFRTQAPSDQASNSSGVILSLTKALVEANRGQFHIKRGPHSGTLIEVVFLRAMARA